MRWPWVGAEVGATVAAWAAISSSRCPDAPPAWNCANVVPEAVTDGAV
jgi:hypothetical protein